MSQDNSITGINKVLFDIGFSTGVFRRDGDLLRKITESTAAINETIREMEKLTVCKKQGE